MHKRPRYSSRVKASSSLHRDVDMTLISPNNAVLPTVTTRFFIQREKYRQRQGVFPVRFTGSFHDFTLIAIELYNRDGHCDQDDNAKNQITAYLGMAKDGACPPMTCFNAHGVNIWLKRFHDYWLRLMNLMSSPIMEERCENAPENSGKSYSRHGEKYSAPFTQHDRDTMIALLLEVFEKDSYSSPSDEHVQQASLDHVGNCATQVNAHLAMSIVDFGDLP